MDSRGDDFVRWWLGRMGGGTAEAGAQGRLAVSRRQEELRPGEANRRRPCVGSTYLRVLRLRSGTCLFPEASSRLRRQGAEDLGGVSGKARRYEYLCREERHQVPLAVRSKGRAVEDV